MESKDGGRAFPIAAGSQVYNQGMTLRDWFAGQDLAAMNLGIDPAENAEWAYKIADAMLIAREARK